MNACTSDVHINRQPSKISYDMIWYELGWSLHQTLEARRASQRFDHELTLYVICMHTPLKLWNCIVQKIMIFNAEMNIELFSIMWNNP